MSVAPTAELIGENDEKYLITVIRPKEKTMVSTEGENVFALISVCRARKQFTNEWVI